MSKEVEIYGFGSYFFDKNKYNDIDVLIVHGNNSPESCRLAIICKQFFVSKIYDIDITIMSKHEESQASFVEMSRAKYLGKVRETSLESDLGKSLHLMLSANNNNDVRCDKET